MLDLSPLSLEEKLRTNNESEFQVFDVSVPSFLFITGNETFENQVLKVNYLVQLISKSIVPEYSEWLFNSIKQGDVAIRCFTRSKSQDREVSQARVLNNIYWYGAELGKAQSRLWMTPSPEYAFTYAGGELDDGLVSYFIIYDNYDRGIDFREDYPSVAFSDLGVKIAKGQSFGDRVRFVIVVQWEKVTMQQRWDFICSTVKSRFSSEG